MPRITQPPPLGEYREMIRTAALAYIEAGLVLIPLKLWDKSPKGINGANGKWGVIRTVSELDNFLALNKGFGLGLNCGESGVIAIDFDIRYKDSHKKAGITEAQFNRWLINNEQLRMKLRSDHLAQHAPVHSATEDDRKVQGDTATPVKVAGRHLFFSNPQGLPSTNGEPPQIDTRGVGGYIVLPPTVIQRSAAEDGTWHQYTVTVGPPNYAVLPDYPQWLADITHPKKATKSPDATPRQQQSEALGLAKMTDVTPHSSVLSGFDANIAYDKAVSKAGPGNRNKAGLWLACQLRDGDIDKAAALLIMERYQEAVTTDSDEYTKEEMISTWNWAYDKGTKREPAQYQGERRTIGQLGNNAVIIDGHETPQHATLIPRYEPTIFGKLPLTDSGNADRFINATRGNVSHNESNGNWMVWSGTQWEVTKPNRITAYGRRVAEYIQVEADSVTSSCDAETKEGAGLIKAWQRHATASQNKRGIDAMVSLAMGDIASKATDYDTNLDYLPCTNGVIDLIKGTLLQHSREMRYTKITHIEYDATATCPKWLRFLDTVTGGDRDLCEYLQMQVGYSLTGRTDQQALFFVYGNGANGKSTFNNTIAKLAGEYHTKINIEGIIDTDNKGGPSPHLVALQGMRYTSGSEFPAGKRINESMIKDLTGGDEISARGLYSDPFTFRPINKFWLMGNYKPRITGTDNGIWRRLILIPFEHTIPEAERMPVTEIEAMFDSELAGILTWAVRGAIAWYAHPQRASLPKPEAVTNAINEYRQEEDTLARFIAEQCDVVTMLACQVSTMFTVYQAWLEEQGERANAWNTTRLTRELKRMGIVQDPGRRKYLGIALRPQGNVTD